LLFAALSVLWGIPYLMIRVAVGVFDPVFVAFGRTFLGALLLLPVALHRKALVPVFRRWRGLLLYSAVEIIGPWWLLGHAETRLTSSTAGLLVAMVPLFAAVLLTVTGHDRFSRRRIVGLVVGFGGVAALVGLDLDLSDLGAVFSVVLVAIGYAFGAYIIGHVLNDLPPIGVIVGSLIVSATVYLPFAIWLRPDHVTAPAVLSVIGLAVLCTALAFLVLFALVAEAGAGRATVITYVNPAVAIVLGIVVLGEPMTIGMAIGFPLVIVGAILATSRSGTPVAAAAPLVGPGSRPADAEAARGGPTARGRPTAVRTQPQEGGVVAGRASSTVGSGVGDGSTSAPTDGIGVGRTADFAADVTVGAVVAGPSDGGSAAAGSSDRGSAAAGLSDGGSTALG
jgi:drug/metabolite transporter (DMT)-like permease